MTVKNTHPDLLDKLTAGIAALTSTEEWRRYLDLQSRFHRYSFSNVQLIHAQREDARRVAGFRTWRGLDRTVRKGEKAIFILAPMIYKTTDEDGNDERGVRGFKWVPVFDVAQTDGAELPAVATRLDGDDPAGHYATLVEVAHSIGFTVHDHHFDGATNGDCSHSEHRIRVEESNAPAQRVKTLAHEIAHALLHETYDSRPLAELEAESTAYVVCQSLGLATDDYSFGYVASWAGGSENAAKAIKTSGERIQRTASAILRAFTSAEALTAAD